MRSGYGRSLFEPLLPLILGRDTNGEVAAIGASVRSLTDTFTDYAILLEDELTTKLVSISHVEASAIPFAALTAWRALKSTARITQGSACNSEVTFQFHFWLLSLCIWEDKP
ncbi:hypothetical protein CsSME_00030728 [Camellia sinensis var. sinensis]